jgi:hypothetical protein
MSPWGGYSRYGREQTALETHLRMGQRSSDLSCLHIQMASRRALGSMRGFVITLKRDSRCQMAVGCAGVRCLGSKGIVWSYETIPCQAWQQTDFTPLKQTSAIFKSLHRCLKNPLSKIAVVHLVLHFCEWTSARFAKSQGLHLFPSSPLFEIHLASQVWRIWKR